MTRYLKNIIGWGFTPAFLLSLYKFYPEKFAYLSTTICMPIWLWVVVGALYVTLIQFVWAFRFRNQRLYKIGETVRYNAVCGAFVVQGFGIFTPTIYHIKKLTDGTIHKVAEPSISRWNE